MALLEVENLTVRAGRRVLVDSITFDVAAAERVAIVGASGSGKSLTASAVVGVTPSGVTVHGRIRLSGHDVTGTPVPRRPRNARAAMVFQDSSTALAPWPTVGAQLDLAVRRHGDSPARHALVRSALRAVAFDDPDRIADARPAQLSGGQRQRVCTVLALLSDAPLLVADEPTTALDVVSQQSVLRTLETATGTDAGPSLLLVTHDIAVAASMCSRIVVVDEGSIIESGSSTAILSTPRHPVTAALVAHARSADDVIRAVAS